MTKTRTFLIISGLLGLMALSACSPNAADFIQISGYDSSGLRTGSVIPSATTLTPY